MKRGLQRHHQMKYLFFYAMLLIILSAGCEWIDPEKSRVIALSENAKRGEVQQYLIAWFDDNLVKVKSESMVDVSSYPGTMPGSYRVNIALDWKHVGFAENTGDEIRLLKSNDGRIAAAYIGNSRYGLFVLGDRNAINLESGDVEFISERIAVYYPGSSRRGQAKPK